MVAITTLLILPFQTISSNAVPVVTIDPVFMSSTPVFGESANFRMTRASNLVVLRANVTLQSTIHCILSTLTDHSCADDIIHDNDRPQHSHS